MVEDTKIKEIKIKPHRITFVDIWLTLMLYQESITWENNGFFLKRITNGSYLVNIKIQLSGAPMLIKAVKQARIARVDITI